MLNIPAWHGTNTRTQKNVASEHGCVLSGDLGATLCALAEREREIQRAPVS